MRVVLDTSVLVPAVVSALPQHEKAAAHLTDAFRGEMDLVLSAHALAECYSSLTALPLSPQITPGQARRLIAQNVTSPADELVALAPADYMEALQRMADLGLRGGAIYDMLHVICAEKTSADEIRTFNREDFGRMPPTGRTDLVVL